MDLSTIQTKLDGGRYSTLNAVATDLRLIAANCLRFNGGTPGAEEYVDAAHAFSLQVNRQLALFVDPAASETVVVRTRKPDPRQEGGQISPPFSPFFPPFCPHFSPVSWTVEEGCCEAQAAGAAGEEARQGTKF